MALRNPEFLQTKKYSAMRDRLALAHGGAVQAGVWGAGDLKVAQRASGANMSVDIASGYALVNANDPGNFGLYHEQNDATVNVAVSPSHATLPRIDQVYLLVNDSTDGGDANDTPQFLVATGSPIAGVTLDAPGVSPATLPTGSLKLADLLIPANSDAGGVVTANIRDRRPFARGFYRHILRNSGSYAVGTSYAVVDATNLSPRVECSGVPVRTKLTGVGTASVANGRIRLQHRFDGAVTDLHELVVIMAAGVADPGSILTEWTTIPTAGSHIVAPYARVDSGTATIAPAGGPGTNYALTFTVEELVRQNGDNT